MDVSITLTVNGRQQSVQTEGDRTLLDVLREDLDLTGTKYGCGEGECRACTVLMDGRPVLSCRTPVRLAEGKVITTIEGLAQEEQLHPLQQAFVEEGAMQCGYCMPGMILAATALLADAPAPSVEDIHRAMNGNLCRCCGYPKIVAAIQRAAGTQRPPAGQTGGVA